LQELNNRFNEQVNELFMLNATLDLKITYTLFSVEDICKLVDNIYPEDFSYQEKNQLRFQLHHYEINVPSYPELKILSLISDLCQRLIETGKSIIYPLIYRLIRLVLTFLVSMATTKQAFSAMKIIKTRLRNRMKDAFFC
jgi:hypothetical protein